MLLTPQLVRALTASDAEQAAAPHRALVAENRVTPLLMYALVGVQQLITITIQTALATRVAAKQARRAATRLVYTASTNSTRLSRLSFAAPMQTKNGLTTPT